MSDCLNISEHYEPGIPAGYIARQEWFAKMDKTHKQRRCKSCKLYVIWEPRLAAALGDTDEEET